jgi:hypothetical protein
MSEHLKLKGPDFIGIGAQRAGTSWLYNCLKEHPEIFMPRKEVHYFDKLHKTHDIDWYLNIFKGPDDKQISGEITPDYMYHQDTIKEIHSNFPDTKLIIILRNPIERSHSAFSLFKSHGRFKNMTFEEALKAEPFLLEQSLYYKQLENVYRYFKREQVLIKLYEDISNKPLEFYQSVCEFLQIDQNFKPGSLKTIKNSSAMSSAQGKFNIPSLQRKIENSILKKPFKTFKNTDLANKLKKGLNNKKESRDILSDNKLKETVSMDINNLETLLNTKLERWKK